MKYLTYNAKWEECFYTTTNEFKSIENHVGVMDSKTETLIATTGANSPNASYAESLHTAKAISQLPQILNLLDDLKVMNPPLSYHYRKQVENILFKIEVGNSPLFSL